MAEKEKSVHDEIQDFLSDIDDDTPPLTSSQQDEDDEFEIIIKESA